VTAGPTPEWIDSARQNADLIFSGSEVMMSDFIAAMPDIDPKTVEPLYLRASAILVRPGRRRYGAGSYAHSRNRDAIYRRRGKLLSSASSSAFIRGIPSNAKSGHGTSKLPLLSSEDRGAL
jgi:hypothetical protein